MFVPFVFTLDERPWSKKYAQGDIFYMYVDACIAYGWPIVAPERYFDRFSEVETSLWGIPMKDFINYMCMRKIPTTEALEAIKTYPIPQACEDSIIAKYPSKADCLNDLLSNENVEFEQTIGDLLDKIISDFNEKPEGILCFEILPKSLISAADKRGIPVVFQLNGLLRRPLCKLRQHPRASFINCMSIKSDFTFNNVKIRYDSFLSEKAGLPMLSRKGIMRLFFDEQYMMDIHNIDNEPEYDIGVLHNSMPAPLHFFGQETIPDKEMSFRAKEKYQKVLVRSRPGFQQYADIDALDDSPSCFHFSCRCKRVVGFMTKGMFDAMLAGRIAHEYGSFVFHLFCNDGIDDDSKGVAPLEFLNFVIFALWAPFPWLTDINHLRLSISGYSEKELFMRSFNYYTQGITKEDLEIYYMSDNRAYRLGDPLYFTSGNKPHEYAAYYCLGGLHTNSGICTWSIGDSTSFEFDLTETVKERLTISIVLYDVAMDWSSPNPTQTVTCVVNGTDCGSITLVPCKKYLRFNIPTECFTDKLQITFRYSYLHSSGDLKIAIAFEQMYISSAGQRFIEDAMTNEIAVMASKISELEANSAGLHAQISGLEAQNPKQKEQIAKLEAQNSKQKEQITKLEAQNSKQKEQISKLELQNSIQKDQISGLEAQKSKLKEQISGLETQNSDQKARISRLEAQCSEQKEQVSVLKAQIQSTYGSRSWKLGNGIVKTAAKIFPRKK